MFVCIQSKILIGKSLTAECHTLNFTKIAECYIDKHFCACTCAFRLIPVIFRPISSSQRNITLLQSANTDITSLYLSRFLWFTAGYFTHFTTMRYCPSLKRQYLIPGVIQGQTHDSKNAVNFLPDFILAASAIHWQLSSSCIKLLVGIHRLTRGQRRRRAGVLGSGPP